MGPGPRPGPISVPVRMCPIRMCRKHRAHSPLSRAQPHPLGEQGIAGEEALKRGKSRSDDPAHPRESHVPMLVASILRVVPAQHRPAPFLGAHTVAIDARRTPTAFDDSRSTDDPRFLGHNCSTLSLRRAAYPDVAGPKPAESKESGGDATARDPGSSGCRLAELSRVGSGPRALLSAPRSRSGSRTKGRWLWAPPTASWRPGPSPWIGGAAPCPDRRSRR